MKTMIDADTVLSTPRAGQGTSAGIRDLVWCEIDLDALGRNIQTIRSLVGERTRVAPVVKGNAYGHGLLLAARAFRDAGADWLCVHALDEARALRNAGFTLPIYILGPIPPEGLEEALRLQARLVLYTLEQVAVLAEVVRRTGLSARVHLKLETGNNRQGVPIEQAIPLADACVANGLVVEGLASHLANVEDTTDHRFAQEQFRRFREAAGILRRAGHPLPILHIANSAATLLWPEAHFDMVRVGIAAYGLWPSRETFVSALLAKGRPVELVPALTWKTRIVQLKDVPVGDYVGYGCTFRTTHPTRLAILPIGYFDGYPRALSNQAHVLVHGVRAPVRGRVCMNLTMVDVTDIPQAALHDEVVVLGRQGGEGISAEAIAEWAGTINYEIVSRIGEHVPRMEVASSRAGGG